MYSNTILKLDLIIIIIQKYCFKYLKPDKDIDKINKSKTIQFVLDQLSDIRKTKDFKTLKSIFTIEKKHKIKDLKDWLNILCANNFKLFSKHFKLDVELDMTKGYRTYVNLLSKLENNKTKVDLKEPNKKISILFNLLFCNIIVGGAKIRHKKRYVPHAFNRKRVANYDSQKSTSSSSKDTKKTNFCLRLVARRIMTKTTVVKSFQNAREIFKTAVINASRKKPITLFKIVALMEVALTQTRYATSRPHSEISCLPQQDGQGTCWIISVISALVYPSNMSKILENICIMEISKLLPNDESIKAIILSRFRLLYTIRKYDQIHTHINAKSHSIHYEFIRDFIQAIFDKNRTFFDKGTDITFDALLVCGGNNENRKTIIKNILVMGFNFEFSDMNDGVTYGYTYKDPNDKTNEFKLVTTNHFIFEQQYNRSGFEIASYIVSANAIHQTKREESKVLSHAVAVVKADGLKKLHCNGWCEPGDRCMAEEIQGNDTFHLATDTHYYIFNTQDKLTTLLIAFNPNFTLNRVPIQESFKKLFEKCEEDKAEQYILDEIQRVIDYESDIDIDQY